MTIRKHLAEQSRIARNRKLDDEQARDVKRRIDAGEPIQLVHADYPFVSRTTIKRIATGERFIR